jgi:putative Holliday junction resolvase
VRDYAADLGRAIDVPIVFWDESLSTVEAEAALRAQGRRGKKLKERVDAVAATLILQAYLDAQRGDDPYDG